MHGTQDKMEFVQMYIALCATYNVKYNELASDMMLMLLKDYSIDEVKAALLRHMQESQWMPKPVEIIKYINEVRSEKTKKISHDENERLAELREIEFEISHAERILSLEQSDKMLWDAELAKSKAKLHAFAGKNAETILANMAAKATATQIYRPEAQHQRGLNAIAKIIGDFNGKIPSG